MQRILTLLFLTLLVMESMAQQDPQYSHNMFNHIATNPGYTGSQDEICATVLQRTQWFGFEGAPSISFLAVEAPIHAINSGIGLTIANDKSGFGSNFDMKLSYAYHLDVANGKLGIGLNLGILNRGTSGEKMFPGVSEPEYAQDSNDTKFDLGMGAFFRNNRFYAGLSATHLLEPAFELSEQKESLIKKHYYITSGYRFALPIQSLELEPSILIKSDGSSYTYSANANVIYNKKFWGGVSYRTGDAVIALIGLELMNGLKLGYAYDITLSKIKQVSSGSHEIYLKYCFKISVPTYTHKYKSARFL